MLPGTALLSLLGTLGAAMVLGARRGGVLAFVEVKARADLETAGFSLYGRQFGRVAAAARLFVKER